MAQGLKEKSHKTARSTNRLCGTLLLVVMTHLCSSAALVASPEPAASPSLPRGILDVDFDTLAPLDPSGVITVTNSWISNSSDKWENGSDWSLGVPPASTHVVMVTNGLTSPSSTKTVTIDLTTDTSASATMTINSLIMGGRGFFPSGIVNDVVVSNARLVPLTIINSILVSNRSSLFLTNCTLNVGGPVRIEAVFTSEDSTITTSNTVTLALTGSTAQWTQINGTWQGNNVVLGGGPGVQGNLNIFGGSVTMSSSSIALDISSIFSSGGAVVLSGGLLNTTNGETDIGDSGIGQMTVSNATWLSGFVAMGDNFESQGTLTVADGGSVTAAGLIAGVDGTGTVWLTGGQIDTMNQDVELGDFGVGIMTVSNGTLQGDAVLVGLSGQGTATFAGGVTTLSTELDLGFNPGSTGTVSLTGGQLVTGFSTLVGDSGVGYMSTSAGTWQSRFIQVGTGSGSQGTLIVGGGTNSAYVELQIGAANCSGIGSVTVSNGSLFVTNTAHNAVLDLESGTLTLSNGTLAVDVFVKTNPCGVFQQTGGTLIVGGVTNVFTPLPFQITSIVRTNTSDLLITWNTGGTSNILQVSSGTGGSFSTNGFTDLINLPVTSTTTNFLIVGAATNSPARYYRIRSPQ